MSPSTTALINLKSALAGEAEIARSNSERASLATLVAQQKQRGLLRHLRPRSGKLQAGLKGLFRLLLPSGCIEQTGLEQPVVSPAFSLGHLSEHLQRLVRSRREIQRDGQFHMCRGSAWRGAFQEFDRQCVPFGANQ